MEMSWMETIELLGLDLLALLLLTMVLFDLVKGAVRSSWHAPRAKQTADRSRVDFGDLRRV